MMLHDLQGSDSLFVLSSLRTRKNSGELSQISSIDCLLISPNSTYLFQSCEHKRILPS